MNEETHPVVSAALGVLGVGGAVYLTWCTIIAFVGGTTPLLGWRQEGSLGAGLFWIFVIDPIVSTVLIWVSALVVLPLSALFKR